MDVHKQPPVAHKNSNDLMAQFLCTAALQFTLKAIPCDANVAKALLPARKIFSLKQIRSESGIFEYRLVMDFNVNVRSR